MSPKNWIAMAMYPMAKVILGEFSNFAAQNFHVSHCRSQRARPLRFGTVQSSGFQQRLFLPRGKFWQGLRFIMLCGNYGFQPSRWRNLGRQDNTHMSYNAYDQMMINPYVFNLHHHVRVHARRWHNLIAASRQRS